VTTEKIRIQERDGMPNTFDWDNAEEIGIQLAEKHPGVDPLTVRFTDLHKWIVELAGFTGDPKWPGTKNFKIASNAFPAHAVSPKTFVRTFARTCASSSHEFPLALPQ
jgi:FeS assembly protein IscX